MRIIAEWGDWTDFPPNADNYLGQHGMLLVRGDQAGLESGYAVLALSSEPPEAFTRYIRVVETCPLDVDVYDHVKQ